MSTYNLNECTLQYFILGCIIHDFAAYILQLLHISNIKTASGSRHGFLSYKISTSTRSCC